MTCATCGANKANALKEAKQNVIKTNKLSTPAPAAVNNMVTKNKILGLTAKKSNVKK